MASQRVDIPSSGGNAGAVNWKGNWNPATNLPPLSSGGVGGSKGDYYTCIASGHTLVDGISTWYVGDKIVNNGTVWEKFEGEADNLASTVTNDSTVPGATVKDALQNIAAGGSGVITFNHRAGRVMPLAGDYDASQVDTLATGVTVQNELDNLSTNKLDKNTHIAGATKTKVTYDADGLVTAGADATTADIADSTNKRYVTDVELAVLGNTSGINTGDQIASTIPTDQTRTSVQDELNDRLKRIAGDFNSFTQKAPAVSNDILLLEDSNDSYNKKKVRISDLPFGSPTINQSETFYVDWQYGNNATADGTIGKPFQTIQSFLNWLGYPTSAADFQRRIAVNLAPGNYIENLTVFNRHITFVGRGVWIQGTVNYICAQGHSWGTDQSTFRGGITFFGQADARYTHTRIQQGIWVEGAVRYQRLVVNIASITGHDNNQVDITTATNYQINTTLKFTISDTVNYNGNYVILSKIGPNQFTAQLQTGNHNQTVTETVGSFFEGNPGSTDPLGTLDFTSINTLFIAGFSADDGIINGGAPKVAYGVTMLTWGSRFDNVGTYSVQGNYINLFWINETQFDKDIAVTNIADCIRSQFYGNITTNTMNRLYGFYGFVQCLFEAAKIFTVNTAGQSFWCDGVSNYSFRTVPMTWAGNTPTIYLTEGSSSIKNESALTGNTLTDALNSIGSPFITTNTTITVKATGGDFTTLAAALTSLNQKIIDASVTVTIAIDAGVFTSASTIQINHPQANRINIVGNNNSNLSTTTLTSFVSVSGSAGAYDVILRVASTTGLNLNDYVQIMSPTGTGEYYSVAGVWKISNVDVGNSQITIRHTYRGSSYPTMTLTGGTVVIHTTVLQFNGCDGFQIGTNLGQLCNLVIAGNGAGTYDGINVDQRNIVYAQGPINLCGGSPTYVAITSFSRNGINHSGMIDMFASGLAVSGCGGLGLQVIQGAKLFSSNSVVSGNNDYGCSFSASNAQFSNSISAGNSFDGIQVQNKAIALLTGTVSCGNVNRGFSCSSGSSIITSGTLTSINNAWDGLFAQIGSSVYVSSTLTSTNNGTSASYFGINAINQSVIVAGTINSQTNTYGDIKVSNQSTVKATTYTGTPVCSPTKDIVGNNQSVIRGTATYTPTELDVTNFNGALSSADTDVQKAFDTLDNLASIKQRDKYYVDGLYGNDTTGNGDIGKPFLTIQKALYAIGHTVDANDYYRKIELHVAKHPLLSEYTENLVFPHRWIDVFAPGVRITGNVIKLSSVARKYNVDTSTVRPCISFYGNPNADARQNHQKIRDGLQIAGNIRTMAQTQTIASISGNGATVTVTVTGDGFAYNAPVGGYVNISGTTAYNGNKLITARTGAQTFTFAGTGTGVETTGSFYECSVASDASTTKDAVYSSVRVDGTITEDDGTVNATSPSTGATIWYSYYSSFGGAIEGRGISLYLIENTEFNAALIISSLSGVLDSLFIGAVTCSTFSSAKFLNVTTPATGINWTVSTAAQTVSVDLITMIYFDRYINWITNKPTFFQLQSPINVLSPSTTKYLSPTGSDNTGDGSIGNPYFSPHRALKDMSGIFSGTAPIIYWTPGTYDYSTLPDLVVDLKCLINASNNGYIYWGISGGSWTTFDSGTFSAQSDTGSNIHTDAGKSWTPGALVGKYLHAVSMNTGSLPGAGNTVNYPRYVPIIKNTATTIETAFFGPQPQSQDVANYEIVDHAVILNFGAKNIQFLNTSIGVPYWFGCKVTTTGDFCYSESGSRFGGLVQQAMYPVINNMSIQCRVYGVSCGEIAQTYVRHSQYSIFAIVRSSAIDSYNTPPVNSRITARRWQDSVAYNNSASPLGALVYFGVGDQAQLINRMMGRSKFYNCSSAITGERIQIEAAIYLDTINFLYSAVQTAITTGINVLTTSSYELKNEPAVARITFDGTTASENYFDSDAGNNLRSLQPNTLPGHFAQTNLGGLANKATNKTGATSVIGTVVSPNNLTAITIAGDTGAQLSLPSIIGVKFSNSNASAGLEGITELYWTLIDTTGTRTFSLYKESTHTNLVAQGNLVGNGVLTFTQQNSSGISGAITVTYTANDTDASNTFRCPIESAVINTPAGANTYIGVITEVVAEGSQVFVARTGTALVLLEDGQSCNVGDFCIISPLVNGRARATGTMPLTMIGFFEESKASGTNVTARVSLRLDNASSGTIYATSVATSTPATSVQGEIDKFNSKTPNDRISCGIRGTSITTGHKAWITMGYDGSFTGWEVIADAVGSIEFDIGKTNYASSPTVSFINGTEPPSLTTQIKNQNLTLSSWTKPFSKGDRIEVLIVSISGITEVNLTLYTKRF